MQNEGLPFCICQSTTTNESTVPLVTTAMILDMDNQQERSTLTLSQLSKGVTPGLPSSPFSPLAPAMPGTPGDPWEQLSPQPSWRNMHKQFSCSFQIWHVKKKGKSLKPINAHSPKRILTHGLTSKSDVAVVSWCGRSGPVGFCRRGREVES